MLGINNPATQHENPKDLNPQHHCYWNLKLYMCCTR